MGFNYWYERCKMEREFEEIRRHCLKANMPEEAIEEIYRIMLDELNNNRKYYTHNDSLDIVVSSENEKSDESWSPYYKQHLEQFSVYQCEISDWGRDAWIEDLDTPEVILWVEELSDMNKEILTYLMVEKLQKQEIATVLGCSPSAISKHMNLMREQLKKILSQD